MTRSRELPPPVGSRVVALAAALVLSGACALFTLFALWPAPPGAPDGVGAAVRELVALALLGEDSGLSILAMIAAAIIGSLVGLFLYSQGWVWGSRAARRRQGGAAALIAVGGGLMAIVAAVALAGLLILLLLFVLG